MRGAILGIGLAVLGFLAACGDDGEDTGTQSTGGSGGGGASGGSGGSGGSSASGGGGNAGATGGVAGSSGSGGSSLDASTDGDAEDAALDSSPDASCQPVPDTTGNIAAIVSAICAHSEQCCGAVGATYATSDCIAQATQSFQSYVDPALCKGGTWNQANVTSCVNWLSAQTCNAPLIAEYEKYWHDTCMEVLVGTENAGTPCLTHLECFAGPGKRSSCTSLKCLVGPIVGIGQACESHLKDPGPTPVCDEGNGITCVNHVCKARLPLGAVCVPYTADCVEGADCAGGVCTTSLEAGQSCGATSSPDCESGLLCQAGVCGGGLGETCNTGLDCWPTLDCLAGKCTLMKSPYTTLLSQVQCQ